MTRRTPLKRSGALRRARLKQSPAPPVPQWVRDYWEWVSEQPCVICAKTSNVSYNGQSYKFNRTEVAHVGLRGFGQKCDPREVIPLCGVLHHRLGPYSHHRLGKVFWSFHELDGGELVLFYRRRYELETGRLLPSASSGKGLRVDLRALDTEVVS